MLDEIVEFLYKKKNSIIDTLLAWLNLYKKHFSWYIWKVYLCMYDWQLEEIVHAGSHFIVFLDNKADQTEKA